MTTDETAVAATSVGSLDIRAVMAAFLTESVVISVLGGGIGTASALALDHLPLRIPMGAFRFAIDAETIAAGLVFALFIGLLGALAPLLRVWRLPIVDSFHSP